MTGRGGCVSSQSLPLPATLLLEGTAYTACMPVTYRTLRSCLQAFPFWQGAIAFACQSVLVIFQIGVVVLAVMEVQRKKAGRPPPKRGVGAPVSLLGRARQRPAPPAVQRMACGRSALLGKASMSPVEDLGRAARTSDRPAAAVGMLGPVCQQRDSSRPVLLAGRWRGSLNTGRAVHPAWLSELGARPAVRIM